jgi:hypothetical protein
MPAYLDSDDLITWLRAMGVPLDITDSQLEYLVSAALSRYSRIRPWYYADTIATVGGTQAYKIKSTVTIDGIDDPVTVIDIAELYYAPQGFNSMPNMYGLPPNWWRMGAGEFYVFDQPTLGYIWFEQFRHLSDVFSGSWSTFEDSEVDTYVRLMPTPTQVQTYPIFLRLLRTQDQIREDDRHIFHLIVMVEVCNHLAASVGLAQTFTDTGMSITTGDGAGHYRQMAMDYENRLVNLTATFAVMRSG